MSIKLEINRLDPAAPNKIDIPGERVTITLPTELPDLLAVQRTFVSLTDQAPLFITLMAAARALFPAKPVTSSQPDHIPEQGS